AGTGQSGPIGSPVVKWMFHAGGPVKTNIAVAGDLVLAASDDGILHVIGLTDGVERWSFRPGTSMTGPATGNGLVYITDGANAVHALDLATGHERWSAQDIADGATPATIAEGTLYVASSNGR